MLLTLALRRDDRGPQINVRPHRVANGLYRPVRIHVRPIVLLVLQRSAGDAQRNLRLAAVQRREQHAGAAQLAARDVAAADALVLLLHASGSGGSGVDRR